MLMANIPNSEVGSAGNIGTMTNEDIIFENPEQLTYFDNSAFMNTEVEHINGQLDEAKSAYRINLPEN